MREIKFRGKDIKNNKWRYGDFIRYSEVKSTIIENLLDTEEWYDVDSKTIGQYTGLKDKNGKEIYEGDIVEVSEYNRKRKYIVKFGKYEIECCGCCYEEHLAYGFYLDNKGSINDIDTDELEVIGNIYDNFELLEVQDE